MLAEMGARVIKVDATPEREQTISTGGGMVPMIPSKSTPARNASRSTCRVPKASRSFINWSSRADVLLHNFRPGVPERLAYRLGYLPAESIRA